MDDHTQLLHVEKPIMAVGPESFPRLHEARHLDTLHWHPQHALKPPHNAGQHLLLRRPHIAHRHVLEVPEDGGTVLLQPKTEVRQISLQGFTCLGCQAASSRAHGALACQSTPQRGFERVIQGQASPDTVPVERGHLWRPRLPLDEVMKDPSVQLLLWLWPQCDDACIVPLLGTLVQGPLSRGPQRIQLLVHQVVFDGLPLRHLERHAEVATSGKVVS
mmetsp:Transcript_56466/g.131578  ORF Transcript_56466/g.131578 Transcript_56466/m.131578 type:complete len:218 (+) Transcript_56466:25-678(+)